MRVVAGLALVIATGLLFFALRAPLANGLDQFLPLPPPPPPPVVIATPLPTTTLDGQKTGAPVWTLDQIRAVTTSLPSEIQGLCTEGKVELREFKDLGSTDPDRLARERNRWQSWGRIWLNRLRVLEKRLPADEACFAHPTMVAACQRLRGVLATLKRLPEMSTIAGAQRTIEQAEIDLLLLTAPPAETANPGATSTGAPTPDPGVAPTNPPGGA
jgi:hypothetical protein